MYNFINHSKIPVLATTDILVIGAGSAGCTAALAAATGNYSVMLIERYGFPGGSSTQMLDTFYGFFTPGKTPVKVAGGFPDVIVNELDALGEIFLRPNTYGAGTGVNYNPERLKQVWDTLIIHSGIKYLLHTSLVDVNTLPGSRYECICWNKSGFGKIIASRVIDGSGDADFCHLAGFGYETAGEYEPAQSMTTTFRMSNVDIEVYEKSGGKKMLKQKMADAATSGKHLLPRKEGSAHEMNAHKCISTVAVKVTDLQALHIDELTKAEIEGRRQAFIYEKFFQQEIPGYEQSNIIGLSNQIGVRETRRVYGEYRLTKEDCMLAKTPEDTILVCGAPIEDHRKETGSEEETYWAYVPGGGVYGVPYSTIVPKGSDTVWVVGRCFSATHDAHASCRSMAQTMSMGQAAGLAAVQSLQNESSASQLNIASLREQLYRIGAILEMPAEKAFTGRDEWSKNKMAVKELKDIIKLVKA